MTASFFMSEPRSIAVKFENVSRVFGTTRAADNLSFEVYDGEFFSMLGPSGSGKTTCLRLIAGFEQPDTGHIIVHGKNVEGIPPYERDVNTVFQDYALFPHMSVARNVEYGLMIKKVPDEERRRRAAEALEMVKLTGMGERKPSQLSGGQRQRVALARALVNRPAVLLLDEPLGALDLKLREAMQVELKSLQRQVGITFIYVTHDQTEALSMSDRLAVFDSGRIEQIGTPAQIYEHPATAFVAGFVGVSNVIKGELAQRLTGSPQAFSIRPEKISLLEPNANVPDGMLSVQGEIESATYLGANTRFVLKVGENRIAVIRQNAANVGEGNTLTSKSLLVAWRADSMQRLS
jgi:putative spermidine/putrescine transport system ATP-binding protein